MRLGIFPYTQALSIYNENPALVVVQIASSAKVFIGDDGSYSKQRKKEGRRYGKN